ncbi:MAG: DUF839 domain-containing protein [Hydrogenothermaceae bacterium]|nr:DUF839 domain-containing protein [Hydrogenothermaceae bacterium]
MRKGLKAFAGLLCVFSLASGKDLKVVSVEFEEVSIPLTQEEITSVRISPSLKVIYEDGSSKSFPLSFKPVIKTGSSVGRHMFGEILNREGNTFDSLSYSRSTVSNNPDGNTLLKVSDRYFLITHLEEPSGMVYTTEIDTKTLNAKSTYPVDFSKVMGTVANCAAYRTPYGTHLGGEEDYNLNSTYADPSSPQYVDCRVDSDGYLDGYSREDYKNSFCWHLASLQRYLQDKNIDKKGYIGKELNIYNYGYIFEIQVKEDGSTKVVKHYITGRLTPEMAIMMPDYRTVYITDDGSYKGFYKLVLHRPVKNFDDNWCGTIYAIKLSQRGDTEGGIFDTSWIKLGEGCDQEIKSIIDRKPLLSDIFNLQDPSSCDTSSGYKLIKEDGSLKCVKLRVGKEMSDKFKSDEDVKKAAAFLETRKYASYLGATVEFEKGEGITYDPDNRKLYFAISSIRNGMADKTGDIQLDTNPCGGVYTFELDEKFDIRSMRGLILGRPLKPGEQFSEIYACSPDTIANPDNLRYIGRDILLIGEDSSKHLNNMLWAYNVKTGKLTRIGTVPTGGEITGMFEFGKIDKNYVITLNIQHPFTDKAYNASGHVSNQRYIEKQEDKSGIVGFILGIPAGIFMER